MHLIQFFLPVYDNDGRAFTKARFDEVRAELTDRFGGVTAYVRTPAVGAWENEDGAICRDDVMLFEVMAPTFDRSWWTGYRRTLEQRFAQEAVLVRAWAVETL
ncbi:MAG TPA: hypothetical protein VEY50_12140 [Lysobacter sp.]|nr:hypothetical protein [Lysobacter sp.]